MERNCGQDLIKNLSSCDQLKSDVDIGTINGCKCLAWGSFYEAAHETSLSFAQLAISSSPKCPLWHLLKAKNLRYARRVMDFEYKPSSEEKEAYLHCFKLTKNPFYTLSVANMYRENNQATECEKIFEEIYNKNPKSVNVRFKLVLYFLKKDPVRAKECLDYIEQMDATGSRFFHYSGKYYEKQRNYEVCRLKIEFIKN